MYAAWDGGSSAPPKTRPHDTLEWLTLNILTYTNGKPHFPESLTKKFAQGTTQFCEVAKLQAEFEKVWPPHGSEAGPVTTTVRAAGSPEIAEGEKLDSGREVDLAVTPVAEFSEDKRFRFQITLIFVFSAVPCVVRCPVVNTHKGWDWFCVAMAEAGALSG